MQPLPLSLSEEGIALTYYMDCDAAQQRFNLHTQAAETYLRENQFKPGFDMSIYRQIHRSALASQMAAIVIAERTRDANLKLLEKEHEEIRKAGRKAARKATLAREAATYGGPVS
jgi:uncharacterized protein (DUF924 family)